MTFRSAFGFVQSYWWPFRCYLLCKNGQAVGNTVTAEKSHSESEEGGTKWRRSRYYGETRRRTGSMDDSISHRLLGLGGVYE